jgi:hypothetical protein
MLEMEKRVVVPVPFDEEAILKRTVGFTEADGVDDETKMERPA